MTYVLLLFGRRGRLRARTIFCESDSEAIRVATETRHDGEVEVYQSGRPVCRVAPQLGRA
jgi:hypothetical protein